IIPKPFDPRLIVELAPAVAKAAMESGVATRPIGDFDAYRQQLNQFVFKSGLVMRPVLEHARSNPKRVIFSAGEDDRVLRATLIAALAVRLGDADAMIAGAYGRFRTHFNHVRDVIGTREGVQHMAGLSLLVMPTRSLFIADTYVNEDPDAETLAAITLQAADAVLRFGTQPHVALL